MSGERTEKASEQRKKKAREEGDIVRSRELSSSAALLAGLIGVRVASQGFPAAWARVFNGAVALGLSPMSSGSDLGRELPKLLLPAMSPIAIIMFAACAAACAAGMLQTGGVQIRPAAIAWKLQRLNPGSNIQALFSMRSLARLIKSLLPAGLLLFVACRTAWDSTLALPPMSMQHLPSAFSACYSVATTAAWISFGWSLLDYGLEWRSWNERLKMSKQELREEVRHTNGDPHVKGRMRQIQRAMRRRRVKADMSRAAVVITNPTHYAVALEFSFETMAAPRVLTKGRDLHAFEIREAAKWAGVPIVENPPLARSLYRSVDEGNAIPFELYSAVAAILAFLFRQDQQRAHRQAHGYSYAGAPRIHMPLLEMEPARPAEETMG